MTAWKDIFESINGMFKTLYSVCDSCLLWKVFSSWCGGWGCWEWVLIKSSTRNVNFDFSLVLVWGRGKASRLLRQGSSVPDPVKRAPSVGALDCRGRVATVYPKCTYIHIAGHMLHCTNVHLHCTLSCRQRVATVYPKCTPTCTCTYTHIAQCATTQLKTHISQCPPPTVEWGL